MGREGEGRSYHDRHHICHTTHTGNATEGTESLHPFEIVCRTIFPNTLTLIITFREGSLSYQF